MPKALIGLLTAAVVVALAGCATVPSSAPQADATTSSAAPSPSASASPSGASPSAKGESSRDAASALGTSGNPVRVATVGDSLTAGGARTIPAMGLDRNTWMSYAEGDGVRWVGGWAMGGTTVQIQAAHVRPIANVDVLVLMSGTNDVRLHIPFDRSRASYERIVSILKPRHVIIGAIPPYNRDPNAAAVYEGQLKRFALAKGWDFTDPWSFARNGKIYVAGTSVDGIHPTTAGYKIVGREFRDAILRVVSTPIAG